MAEVLLQFAEPILSSDKTAYRAQATGTAMNDGLWEAWIEFIPVGGGAPVRSPRETTQSTKADAIYWASGLSATYLEGALGRALRGPINKPTMPAAQALFSSPAPEFNASEVPEGDAHAILDPFSVYEKGEALLQQELHAMSAWHLVNIIVAYRLSEQPVTILNRLPQATLIDLIVTAVRGVREHVDTMNRR
jgi:hypothetical protein